MDKVQVILGYLQKYHFWLLCVLAVVAGLFGWMSARSQLSEEYNSNKSTVTSKFTTLQGIQSEEYPPNSSWTEQISALTKQEQQEVAAAWKAVYEEQQKVLAWPDVMPADFKRWINSKPPDADIPGLWITLYQTEVLKTEFPKLAKIVDAAPMGEKEKDAPVDGTRPHYKVVWENQEKLFKQLELPGRRRATSFEVRMRQEDLWVVQALLSIIAKTNEGSLYSSRVKRIEELAIGAETADKFAAGMKPGHIKYLTEQARDAATPEPRVPMDGELPPPDEGRYVDAEGAPQSSGMWKEQQFKRMPVHLRLVMDQREVTRLLAACANYPLPVEVRQLRINPGADGGSKPKEVAPGGAPTATSADAYDVTVEISGIIYIFNPPDPARLGAEETDALAAG